MKKGKVMRRQDLPVSENVYGGMTEAELSQALEKELQLAQQDIKIEQTKDRKNMLESYVYETRSKLLNTYRSFATELEKEGISRNLQQTEDWLYDDGVDEFENIYSEKFVDCWLLGLVFFLGADLQSAEILINVSLGEPSWWVWVTDEMVPSDVEEHSGIDNESYLVLSEEHVVDGVANFMARCILSNPKTLSMSPEELQKTLTKALGGMNKFEKMLHIWHAGTMFCTLATWGLALAGSKG